MKRSRSCLFHFTKSIDSLMNILSEGYYPHYCLEDLAWQGIEKLEFLAFPTVCFCDIPIARISEHVEFYGEYGLGMSKKWALTNQLNPLIYISESSLYTTHFLSAFRGTYRAYKDSVDNDFTADIFYMFAYSKQISGRIIIGDKTTTKDFYLENEWRHVPEHANIEPILLKPEYDNAAKRAEANEKAKRYGCLQFTPADVRYIFVKCDADIPALVNFINEKLDKYPSADLKILTTRITSLEHIERDM